MIIGLLVLLILLSTAGLFVATAIAIDAETRSDDIKVIAVFATSIFVWAAAITTMVLVV